MQNTKSAAVSLLEMAKAIVRDAPLERFLPKEPTWCRNIGMDVFFAILDGREVDKVQCERLRFAYGMALRAKEGAEIGAAYAGPTHGSVEEARKTLVAALDQILAETLAYNASQMQPAA